MEMAMLNNGGHIGPALSLVEIMVIIYEKISKINKKNFKNRSRDRVILSKGHGCLVLYSILHERKILSKKILKSYCKSNSILG